MKEAYKKILRVVEAGALIWTGSACQPVQDTRTVCQEEKGASVVTVKLERGMPIAGHIIIYQDAEGFAQGFLPEGQEADPDGAIESYWPEEFREVGITYETEVDEKGACITVKSSSPGLLVRTEQLPEEWFK
ncbi:MAG TPA: hypothetical protein VJL83_03740 [Patescibacteria group bacterium]|nr:hypothetical protein [Patescibacteria group bacterium]